MSYFLKKTNNKKGTYDHRKKGCCCEKLTGGFACLNLLFSANILTDHYSAASCQGRKHIDKYYIKCIYQRHSRYICFPGKAHNKNICHSHQAYQKLL